MLYLPPNVPHHGVAETACLTISVGMRAPSVAELLGDWIDTLLADTDDSMRYRDPDLVPARDPAEIDDTAMSRVIAALNTLRMDDPERLGDWFGRFITTYRSAGVPAPDPELLPWAAIQAHLNANTAILHRHPFSRMSWRRASGGARLYVSGQEYPLPLKDARRLANADMLDGQALDRLSAQGVNTVQALYQDGHYQCVPEG